MFTLGTTSVTIILLNPHETSLQLAVIQLILIWMGNARIRAAYTFLLIIFISNISNMVTTPFFELEVFAISQSIMLL